MPIVVNKQVAIPAGLHKGVIIGCEETTKIFSPAKGPEPTVEVTIQPDFKKDGYQTLSVSSVTSPVLNDLSKLSRLLNRLGAHPAEGETWDPASIIGRRVTFAATVENGFVRVDLNTVKPDTDAK